MIKRRRVFEKKKKKLINLLERFPEILYIETKKKKTRSHSSPSSEIIPICLMVLFLLSLSLTSPFHQQRKKKWERESNTGGFFVRLSDKNEASESHACTGPNNDENWCLARASFAKDVEWRDTTTNELKSRWLVTNWLLRLSVAIRLHTLYTIYIQARALLNWLVDN